MQDLMWNALALVAGIVGGGAVNMALITVSARVIPPPAGVDPRDIASLKANIHRFEPKHFLMPFLAHALGTLVGALLAYLIAATYGLQLAYAVGAFFLLGGIAASRMIPAPRWFIVLDLVAAYLPMAWLGILAASGLQR